MHSSPEPITEFLATAVPETTRGELSDWCDERRTITQLHGVLVAIDETVAEMSYAEFCEAVLDSDSTSAFTALVEVYDRAGERPAIYRVTGSDVVDPPRYFLDAPSVFLVLFGRYARDDVATALYDPSVFDESSLRYLNAQRLFSHDDRENRAAQILRGNAIVESLVQDAVQDQSPSSTDTDRSE